MYDVDFLSEYHLILSALNDGIGKNVRADLYSSLL